MDEYIVLVYDFTLGRPGCALFQAAWGENTSLQDFDPASWIVAPNETMGVYRLTADQYQHLVNVTRLVMQGMTVHDANTQVKMQRSNEAT